MGRQMEVSYMKVRLPVSEKQPGIVIEAIVKTPGSKTEHWAAKNLTYEDTVELIKGLATAMSQQAKLAQDITTQLLAEERAKPKEVKVLFCRICEDRKATAVCPSCKMGNCESCRREGAAYCEDCGEAAEV